MKNSKEYSKKIKSLYRSLKRRRPKVQQINHENIAEAVVYAIISEKTSESATEATMKKFAKYFVDLNDLRVSRAEEIIEMLEVNTPLAKDIASTITKVLQGIFNTYHRVSLEALKKLGKRPARKILEKIDGTSRFVVDYCMLTSLNSHAIPLTGKMIEYLRVNELVEAEADEQDIAGFLTKQISAKDGYEFYSLLRCESETPKVITITKKRTKTTLTKKKVKKKKKTTKRKK